MPQDGLKIPFQRCPPALEAPTEQLQSPLRASLSGNKQNSWGDDAPRLCQQLKRDLSGAWGRMRHPSIPATREVLQMAKIKTNLGNLSSVLGRRKPKLTLSRAGRMSQSLKSPSADSPKVQGGAGILGCSEIATGFSILHISFPIKSSKILVPSSEDLQNIILCLLPPGAGVEGVQRKVLQGSSQQRTFETAQIKPNTVGWSSGSFCWESSVILRGTQSSWQVQCQVHMQGAARLGLPSPVSMQGSAGREHNSMASVSQQGQP